MGLQRVRHEGATFTQSTDKCKQLNQSQVNMKSIKIVVWTSAVASWEGVINLDWEKKEKGPKGWRWVRKEKVGTSR